MENNRMPRLGARCKTLAFAGLFVLLAGCQQDLYSGLKEGEANLILATLLENGIDAEKIARGKTGFAIAVDKADLVRALKLLEGHSLPRPAFKNMGEVFSGQGMIASPTEEQARLAFAISQELAETFAQIDGVLTSRAHVVLARHDAASATSTPSSASIFLRHAPDSPVVDLQGKIKETCVQSVPGLEYDKVSVMLVTVRESVLLPERRGEEKRDWMGFAFSGLFAALALVAGGLALKWRAGATARREPGADA
jgi:type III secretion protein J